MLLLTTLVFFAVTLTLAGLFVWLMPTRAEQRLQEVLAPSSPGPGWAQTVVRVTGPFARLSSPEGDWDTSPLRMQFLHAGIRHPDARLVYFCAKTLLPLLFAP